MFRGELVGLQGFPVLTGPADLEALVADCLAANGVAPRDGDVLVVAQKVVSKAENRLVDLRSVEPGQEAQRLAAATGKNPRLVQVILSESARVVRWGRGHIITEHRLGYVCANAGVDLSNVAGGGHVACLLPLDPDASAQKLLQGLQGRFGVRLAVIISDTHGRAWRNGAIGLCIGAAGLDPLRDYRGQSDLYGRELYSSQEAVADEMAAAASLIMGQGDEGVPLVLLRGLRWKAGGQGQRALIRPREEDLFR